MVFCFNFSCPVPNPPLNVSLKIIHLSGRGASGSDVLKASHNASVLRRARDIPAAEEQEEEVNGEEMSVTQVPLNESVTAGPNSTELLWAEPTGSPAPTEEEEEFVNALVPEYEDSNEPGSAMDVTFEPSVMPTPLPPILLELRWLPPRPSTAYDGFNIYIYRDGESHCDLYTAKKDLMFVQSLCTLISVFISLLFEQETPQKRRRWMRTHTSSSLSSRKQEHTAFTSQH